LVFAGGGGLAWVITGAVLVALRAGNVLSWLILAVGVCWTWSVGLDAYAKYVALQPSLPVWVGATAAHALGVALGVVAWAVPSTVLVAFYPDGRLPGPRWRWLVAGAAGAILVDGALFGWAVWTQRPQLLLLNLDTFVLLPWMLAIGVGAIVRLVRARPPQRQQLAWLVSAVLPLCVVGQVMPWLHLGSSLVWFYLLANLPVCRPSLSLRT
jgi:hypothetical protein